MSYARSAEVHPSIQIPSTTVPRPRRGPGYKTLSRCTTVRGIYVVARYVHARGTHEQCAVRMRPHRRRALRPPSNVDLEARRLHQLDGTPHATSFDVMSSHAHGRAICLVQNERIVTRLANGNARALGRATRIVTHVTASSIVTAVQYGAPTPVA